MVRHDCRSIVRGSCEGHREEGWDGSSLGPQRGSRLGFESLGITTTSALPQTFGILSWRKQEKRNPRSQDFKPGPAWIKSSGQIESGPGALPGFKGCRVAVNSLEEKSQEIFPASRDLALQRSDNSCTTEREISRFALSYFLFFTCWLAITFA